MAKEGDMISKIRWIPVLLSDLLAVAVNVVRQMFRDLQTRG